MRVAVTTEERKYALLTLARMMMEVEGIALRLGVTRARVAAWLWADNAMPLTFDRQLGRMIKQRADIWSQRHSVEQRVKAGIIHRANKQLHPALYSRALKYDHIRESIADLITLEGNQGRMKTSAIVEHFDLQGISRQTLYNAVATWPRLKKHRGVWELRDG